MNSKRHLLVSAIVCCVAGCLSLPAAAQAYPTKPIRLVVPFGAGGVADLTARTVVQKMAEGLGQSVVIDNKPGAGGVVAGDEYRPRSGASIPAGWLHIAADVQRHGSECRAVQVAAV